LSGWVERAAEKDVRVEQKTTVVIRVLMPTLKLLPGSIAMGKAG